MTMRVKQQCQESLVPPPFLEFDQTVKRLLASKRHYELPLAPETCLRLLKGRIEQRADWFRPGLGFRSYRMECGTQGAAQFELLPGPFSRLDGFIGEITLSKNGSHITLRIVPAFWIYGFFAVGVAYLLLRQGCTFGYEPLLLAGFLLLEGILVLRVLGNLRILKAFESVIRELEAEGRAPV
jgi:hypothetical protein